MPQENKAFSRLLITGGSGFLGKRVADHFQKLGYCVLTPGSRELNIGEEAAVLAWFRENRPEAVIHCAAISDTGTCEKEPERSHKINVEGACHVAKGCALVGAKLIFCSSDQVYFGSACPGPHKEDVPVTPGNVYGRQKLLAEQRCAEICPDTVSLRLSWMYADRQLPEEHGQFLSALTAALKDPSLPLTWPVYDRRGITDAAAVAQNLTKALYLPAGVYNFGAGNDRDTYHTVKTVLENLGLEEALARLTPNTAAFAVTPRDIRMDTTKAEAAGIRFDPTVTVLCRVLAGI